MYHQEVVHPPFRKVHFCSMLILPCLSLPSSLPHSSFHSPLWSLLAVNFQTRSLIRCPFPYYTSKFPALFWKFLSESLCLTYQGHEDKNQIHYFKILFTHVLLSYSRACSSFEQRQKSLESPSFNTSNLHPKCIYSILCLLILHPQLNVYFCFHRPSPRLPLNASLY